MSMIIPPKTIDDIRQNREEWAQALESGTYRQTKGKLRRRNAMCCLGVLCDITDQERWEGEFYGGENKLPPQEILDIVGLRDAGDAPHSVLRFTRANDYERATFKDIAQMIRDTPLPEVLP
jgi:hypothetical protein